MKDKNTTFYILGIISGLIFIPVIQELLNLIASWIQVLLLWPNKIILKGNRELSELQNNEEYQETNCIGFQIQNDDYEYDDE